jgi:hypothetical protein
VKHLQPLRPPSSYYNGRLTVWTCHWDHSRIIALSCCHYDHILLTLTYTQLASLLGPAIPMPYPPWQRPSPLAALSPRPSQRPGLMPSSGHSSCAPSPLPMTPQPYPYPPSMQSSSSRSSPPPPPPFSEIIPRLYLGDHSAAENTSLLVGLGITHVLSTMRGTVYIPRELRLRHSQVSIEDLPFAELAAHLPGTTSFIADAMRDPNAKILVHCMQGVSRSASVLDGGIWVVTAGCCPVCEVKKRNRRS